MIKEEMKEMKKNSTVKMRLTCAIIFVTFCYTYLNYQGGVLAAAQHVLSGGVTTYNHTLAPLLITFVLFLVQVGVFSVTHVKRRFHGLTYFPSLLLLTIITDIPNDVDCLHGLGGWWWLVPLLLVLYGGVMWIIMQTEPLEPEPNRSRWLSRDTWQSVLLLCCMMVLTTLVASNDRIFHQKMKMECLMKEGRYAEALEVGKKSLDTDSSLVMLRAACLYKVGGMGDRLFSYPMVGGSKAMMIDSVTTKSIMWKAPKWITPPSKLMQQRKIRYVVPADYKLCGLLLDKKLDLFVKEVQKHYDVTASTLPKHYAEALMLYTHRRTRPSLVYSNNVMEADFQDYQALEHKFAHPQERQSALCDTYGNTYWYYFQFGKK